MIVVTGAAGFIGAALCRALALEGAACTPLTRDDVELTDASEVRSALVRLRPRAIVHLAASLDKREDETDRARQWRDTFHAGVTLIEQACALGVPRVIVAGTLEELGPAEGVLTASTPPRPASTYGLCKHLLRQVAEHWAPRSETRIDWVRPFVVYGPGQTGSMLLPYAFAAARGQHAGEFSDGLQERDLLYIDDLVAWFRLALGTRSDAGGFTLHHLGAGEAVAIRDVLEAIAEEFPGARFELGRRSRRIGEPHRQCAPLPAEATTIEGWAPRVPWRTGVALTAAWWRETDVTDRDRTAADRVRSERA
jgi:nucleoside-diphosphate-sugar epimerase